MNYYVHVWESDYSTEKGEINNLVEGTFHYNATNGTDGKLRLGNVCSSYCEFDYFTGGDFEIDVGDIFDFRYKIDTNNAFQPNGNYTVAATDPNHDGNVEISGTTATDGGSGDVTLVAHATASNGAVTIYNSSSYTTITSEVKFFVQSVKVKRGVAHVVGYDAVYFLNVDYSPRLAQIQSSFPMKMNALLQDVCTYCGITPTILYNNAASLAEAKVSQFYREGITAREIVRCIAELIGFDYLAGTSSLNPKNIYPTRSIASDRTHSFWMSSYAYVICPDDGTYYYSGGQVVATNVWYKENSFDINSHETAYDGVEFVASSGQSLGHYYSSNSPSSIYYIANNILLDNIVESTMDHPFSYYAQDILTGNLYYGACVNQAYPYIAANVEIFPFRNPYVPNCMTRIVDTDGTYYNLPIMSMDITDDRARIESYGTAVGYDVINTGAAIAKAPPVWITYDLLNSTYGTLKMLINRTAGVGIISWIGNGTTPSNEHITASLSPYKSAVWGIGAAVEHGHRIALFDSNDTSSNVYVSVWLATSNYSQGSLTFPLDQSS